MIEIEMWKDTEKLLLKEADSLGELVDGFRDFVSPKLIGAQQWECVVDRARELPVTMGAFPFGFEIPLHQLAPHADFGVSLFGGSKSAETFAAKSKKTGSNRTSMSIVRLLNELQKPGTNLNRVAGKKMLLEYDIDSTGRGNHPDPGIFVYPDEDKLIGDGAENRVDDLEAVVEAISLAAGWELDSKTVKEARRVYETMTPNTTIRAIGAFPSRDQAIRLAITGIETNPDLMDFLGRVGWRGNSDAVSSFVSLLESRRGFDFLGCHFDLNEKSLGDTLGLSFYKGEGQWLKDYGHWETLVETIREQHLAVPEKLDELRSSTTGSQAMFGRAGVFVLVRGIHHIKLNFDANGVDKVKVYVFFLTLKMPNQSSTRSK